MQNHRHGRGWSGRKREEKGGEKEQRVKNGRDRKLGGEKFSKSKPLYLRDGAAGCPERYGEKLSIKLELRNLRFEYIKVH